MGKMKFSYAVLQYRYDYMNGEALNVGVLVFCAEARFVQLKVRSGGGRVLAAYPDLSRKAFTEDLRQLARGAEHLQMKLDSGPLFEASDALGLSKFTEQRDMADDIRVIAYQILKHDASSFRWEVFGSGLTDDPETALERSYNRFVSRFEQIVKTTSRTDDEVFEPAKRLFRQVGLYKSFREHEISTDLQTVRFHHAIPNGKWHCIQPLSFDLATVEGVEDKSARWTGSLFNIRSAEERFKVYLLAGKPKAKSVLPAYERALKALRSAPTSPTIFEETETDALVDTIVGIERSGRLQ